MEKKDKKEFSNLDITSLVDMKINEIAQISKKISDGIKLAKSGKEAASTADKKSAGWSLWGNNKKEAIEALQEAVVQQADATYCMSEANCYLFEYNKKIAEAMMIIFTISIASAASTRLVISTLKNKLEYASRNELNEEGRNIIQNLITQLNGNLDVFQKFENLKSEIELYKKELGAQGKIIRNLQSEMAILKKDMMDNRKKGTYGTQRKRKFCISKKRFIYYFFSLLGIATSAIAYIMFTHLI